MSKKSNWSRILLTGASLAAMGAIAPAFAQDDVSEEIVVTATGRASAIQDVPLAVTAIGAETLANSGVQDLRDITQVAPSFSMSSGQSQSSGTSARIRGIGTGSDNPGFEAAVGIFIDGVYRARAGAALADLPELERVEVLRGPQGTLFGRNTSAGAISVITAAPDFDPGMYIESSFGFDDTEETGARAGVNIPVGDTVAFRLDGSVRARDGYITDLISGDDLNTRDRSSVRGQMIWDISPDASLRVIADAAQTDEVCCAMTPVLYGFTQAIIAGISGPASSPGFAGINALSSRPVSDRYMTVTPGRGYSEVTDEHGISAQLDWDLGGVNLTSITAMRNWEATRDQDVDFNLIDIAYRDGLEVSFENFTQEIRLQGERGRLNWLVGVFYADETLQSTDRIRIGADSSLYANSVTDAALSAVSSGQPCGAGGAELYNFGQAPLSIFQCAVGLLPGGLQANALAAVNSVNGGYLTPNVAGNGQQNDVWGVDTTSLALFTHNEFAISDRLMLTVGLRYSQEEKDLQANLFANGASCASIQAMEDATNNGEFGVVGAGVVTALINAGLGTPMNLACNPAVNSIANGAHAANSEEEEFSGTASLAYDLSDDVMIYGGYSRGYKAGGFNVDRSGFDIRPSTINPAQADANDLRFDAEFTDAYEIGIKSTVLGGTTTLNLTGFMQQISDYQLNAFNGFNFITQNIPDVVSQGVEFEVQSRPTDSLTLNAGVVYTDAYYDSTVRFNPATACLVTVPVTRAVPCSTSGSVANPNDPNAVYAGGPLALVPEWTVTGGIGYEMPLTGNLSALFYLDARWNSEYQTQTLSRNAATDNDSFAIFNGRIAIGPQDERWSLELWGRNLGDETYYVGAFSPPLQDGTYVVYPNEPATYGITIRASY